MHQPPEKNPHLTARAQPPSTRTTLVPAGWRSIVHLHALIPTCTFRRGRLECASHSLDRQVHLISSAVFVVLSIFSIFSLFSPVPKWLGRQNISSSLVSTPCCFLYTSFLSKQPLAATARRLELEGASSPTAAAPPTIPKPTIQTK